MISIPFQSALVRLIIRKRGLVTESCSISERSHISYFNGASVILVIIVLCYVKVKPSIDGAEEIYFEHIKNYSIVDFRLIYMMGPTEG